MKVHRDKKILCELLKNYFILAKGKCSAKVNIESFNKYGYLEYISCNGRSRCCELFVLPNNAKETFIFGAIEKSSPKSSKTSGFKKCQRYNK